MRPLLPFLALSPSRADSKALLLSQCLILLILLGSVFGVNKHQVCLSRGLVVEAGLTEVWALEQRTFHRIGILVVFITAICYFIMASNLGTSSSRGNWLSTKGELTLRVTGTGSTPIQVQFRRTFTGTTRGVVNGIPTRAIWCVDTSLSGSEKEGGKADDCCLFGRQVRAMDHVHAHLPLDHLHAPARDRPTHLRVHHDVLLCHRLERDVAHRCSHCVVLQVGCVTLPFRG